jgi:hypothetical protein
MSQPMGAPGWGQPQPAGGQQPGPGWAPGGYGTGAYPVAPTWNPAAGWGQSGFTPLPGYRSQPSGATGQQPGPPA